MLPFSPYLPLSILAVLTVGLGAALVALAVIWRDLVKVRIELARLHGLLEGQRNGRQNSRRPRGEGRTTNNASRRWER